ncbi:MAG: glycosyltransferase family 2 protein [bacterium]
MTSLDKLSSLSVFMPAYNEEANISNVVLEACEAAKKIAVDYEVIVVNDGSKDDTGKIVTDLAKKNHHIKLVNHIVNKGYGGAVKSGLDACSKEYIFFTDSDGQFHFDELGRFVKLLSRADLVMGYRRKRMDPFHRVFLAQVLLKIWNYVLFGLTVKDVDCAYKLFPRKVSDNIKLETESAITVTEFIVKAWRLGFVIHQAPVTHYARKFGEQTGGNWRVILRAATDSFHLYKQLQKI